METAINLGTKSKDELIELLEEQKSNYEAKIVNYCHKIASLEYQLKNLLRHRFGKRSEKVDEQQLSLFDEMVKPTPEEAEVIEEAEVEITIPEHQRKKPGRKPLPKELPRVQKIYELSEDEKVCSCGACLEKIGEERSEQLDIIPAKIQVIEHVRYKYACKSCEERIATAKGPQLPIPKSLASPGLLAYVATAKFCDHLPLYRQEKIFQRLGIDIPRNTLSYWMIKASELLKPLYDCLKKEITYYDIGYADETRVQVLKEGNRPAEAKSYMWCINGGAPYREVVVYHYNESRSHEVIKDLLEGFKGYLHCDGFSAYDTLAKVVKNMRLLGCWMHCRRKFFEVTQLKQETGLASKALQKIGKLFRLEAISKKEKLTPEEIFIKRKTYAKPMLDDFKAWLDEHVEHVLPKTPLGEAFGYAINQWPKLIRYLEDGRLEMDNGRSERAIKPFVIGRKNWMFCDSIAGARAAEVIFSVVETGKLHGRDPYEYLRFLFEKLPLVTNASDLINLLPFKI